MCACVLWNKIWASTMVAGGVIEEGLNDLREEIDEDVCAVDTGSVSGLLLERSPAAPSVIGCTAGRFD